MRMFDIILKKRDKGLLTYEELKFFIDGIVNGSIPDYQTTALLMAVFINGMNNRETSDLCLLMAESGDMMNFSDEYTTVDKHSTGGVGDKTSLIVAPIAAACGLTVAKMSGRALGHTGGTIDKLESIPGLKLDMSIREFERIYKKAGICIAGQSGNMVPADKILYGLRDVTATVGSISLIAASIMSKKLAAGAGNIILDVKTGSGAFMGDIEEAFLLAEKMVEIGLDNGRNIVALVTMMDAPLGYNIGNSLEVQEAVDVLKGCCASSDLYEVSVALASELISMSKKISLSEAKEKVEGKIHDGTAFIKLRDMVDAQGGNIQALDDYSLFKQPAKTISITAPEDGFLSRLDAKKVGVVSMNLGAGRSKKTDPIDYSAGIRLMKKPGDEVRRGETVAYLYSDLDNLKSQINAFKSACRYSKKKPEKTKLILGRVSQEGREIY